MTGFNSKQRMAADKLQDGKCKYCVDGCIACDARAQPAQDVDYWIREATAARQAEMALRRELEALALPAQEPVAWPCLIVEADFSQDTVTLTMQCDDYKVSAHKHWLSTTPPKREWVGLTEEEIRDCLGPEAVCIPPGWSRLTRAIEAKLKEKNT